VETASEGSKLKLSVYGGTGFVGSEFVRCSKFETERLTRENLDPSFSEVVYFVGTTDNYNVLENPKLDIEVNLEFLIDQLETLRKKFSTFRFNYISSWFVYGDAQKPPFKESGPCEPKGFYSISKFAAELFIKSYCATYGIEYRIIRLSNIFGSSDGGVSKKKNALQHLVNEIKNHKTINLYEGGDFVRDYLEVRDAAAAIDCILENAPYGITVNVGSGEPTRFLDLMTRAKEIFESNSELESIETPEFHKIVQVRDSWLDTSILRSYGFVPKYPIIGEISNL
jgi:nucleoside-diphosphate-sugar epimerase